MMTADSGTSPELLAAEIAAIEDLLMNYEDWRAWAQLEARERQGELPPSVAASGLKTLLLDKLAVNPLFLRRQALVKQAEQASVQARARASAEEGDDLTRIRGIDARMERRLNNLAVRSYAQIAAWAPADVHYFASTLGLGELIASQMWIEQAASLRGGAQPAVSSAYVAAMPAAASPIPATPAAAQRPAPPQPAEQAAPAAPSKPEAQPASAASTPLPPATLPDPEAAGPAGTPKASPQKSKAPAQIKGELAASASPAPKLEVPAQVPPGEAKQEAKAAEAKPVVGAAQKPASATPVAATVPAPATTAKNESSKSGAKPVEAAKPVQEAPALATAKLAAEPVPPATVTAVNPPEPLAAGRSLPDEPAYPLGKPAKPLQASAYAGYVPDPPSLPPAEAPRPIRAAAIAANGVHAHAPEIDASVLRPALPAPARAYAGGAVEPGHGLIAAANVPAPMPAALFAGAVSETAAVLPAPAVAAPKSDTGAAPAPQPRASDILQPSLPPLPLTPAKAADAKAPPPLPPQPPAAAPPAPASQAAPTSAQLATVQAAAMAAAASASAAAPKPAPAAPAPALSAPAVKTPEELLRAAAERAAAAAASPASGVPPPLPPAPPKSIVINEEGPSYAAAPEARVTIRRSEDTPAAPVIKVPGATDVHLSRRPNEKFDGNTYAAYHTEVEEASVQIVRKPGARTPPNARPSAAPKPAPAASVAGTSKAPGAPQAIPAPVLSGVPAGAPPPLNAAEAAARAAAALNASAQAVRAAAEVTGPRQPEPPARPPLADDPLGAAKKGAEKAAQTMGRFLKALTGQ